MDSAWPQSPLCDFKASACTKQYVFQWHAYILKHHLGVTERGVVITQCCERANQLQAWRIFRNQYLCLLLVAIGVVRVRLSHHDKDTGALVQRAGDKPFATV